MSLPVYLNTKQIAERLAFDGKDPREAVREWLQRWGVPVEYRGRSVIALEVSVMEGLKRAKKAQAMRRRTRLRLAS